MFAVQTWVILGSIAVLGAVLLAVLRELIHIRDTFKTQAAKMSRDLVEQILMDEELMEELIDKIVVVIQNSFASSRGVTAKDQKGLDRQIVRGMIDQNPVMAKVLEEVGIKDYLIRKPHLVFWILSQYPQLLEVFGQGQGASQPGTSGVTNFNILGKP